MTPLDRARMEVADWQAILATVQDSDHLRADLDAVSDMLDKADAAVAAGTLREAALRIENARLQAIIDGLGEPNPPVPPIKPGQPGRLDAKLLPPAGRCIIGATTPAFDRSFNYVKGHAEFVAVADGVTPDLTGFYNKGATKFPTAAQLQASPGAVMLHRWKPLGANSPGIYKRTLSGDADATIRTVAASIQAFGRQLMVAPMHEPENDDATGVGDADYARAWRYTHDMVGQQGVGNVTWVWNMMGWPEHGPRYPTLYPGDDIVDVISADIYVHNAKDTWATVLNRTAANGAPSIYRFAEAHGKPLYLSEFGIGRDVVAQAGPRLFSADGIAELRQNFPWVKGVQLWNQSSTDRTDAAKYEPRNDFRVEFWPAGLLASALRHEYFHIDTAGAA